MTSGTTTLVWMNAAVPRLSCKWKVVANIFFCATLFPFVSPFPIETDTQPVAFIVAAAILLWSLATNGRVAYGELVVLLFPILGLFYLDFLASDPLPAQIGKYLSLVAGSVVYVAAKRSFHLFSSKVFFYSIVVYFGFSILLMLAPDTFFNVQALFVRAVNTAGEENPFGYRGVPTLATEPGLFGGLLIYHFFILEYFKRQGDIVGRSYWAVIGMLVFMVLATKSGTGYLYFFLYLTYLVLRQKNGVWKAAGGLLGFIGVFSFFASTLDSYSDLGRGFEIISGLMRPEILLGDTSTVGRLYDFFLGFVSLAEYPFGSGVNGVDNATLALCKQYSFLREYYGFSVVGLVSGLAWCFVAYGAFAVLYFSYIYLVSTRSSAGSRVFSLIFLSFSYSPAFPGLWLLIAQPPIHSRQRTVPGVVDS